MTPFWGVLLRITVQANGILSYDGKNRTSSLGLSIISLMYFKSLSEISRIETRLAHPVNMINKVNITILFNVGMLQFTNIHKNVYGIIYSEIRTEEMCLNV